ncbi:DNA topoisomerase I [Blastocystis sp. subtype 4]|uniref:DNA topoisomerase I n=1 Tax=Blastocystis sp. subtype 4 TaxID=944170 RepID=UPI0007117D43|nr:DNA topoisomerase I [Blastocystis sp. subtype 4]KNB44768.1 DNA topoisomerase I [Blastocystis sp. subtype 4]|eukprot:XP_014528191.1 DNA topoisomerase I [Blastocystis sp. subtype 4]
MDEDDIDDFLDSNGDSENDGSKSHHHFDIINRNTSKTKRSAKSRPTVKKENTNDTGSTKKSVKRHATPSAPSKRVRVKEELEEKVENQLQKAKTVVKKTKPLTPIQLFDRAVQAFKWWEHQRTDNGVFWTSLQHNGVTFQPPYTPHNVPLYYDGQPVKLTPEQEEIATLYAMETLISQVGEDAIQLREPASAKIFKDNFFSYFKEEMGVGSVVKSFDKCDFTAIRRYLEERKKNTVKATAEEKQQLQMRMGYVLIDGNVQKTGNFVVEPPSLFRGRGLHPKMGSVKMRVIPEQVELNVDLDMAIPVCPMKGHNWDTLVNRPETSWMAHWVDNVQDMGKYMGVNTTSFLKGQHDMEKYEIARRLKNCIDKVRESVLKELKSTSLRERQLATAIWIIDKLALRVGNEKSEEEADTVGCCSLRVEHLSFEDPYTLTMDFLAKDSMRYHQVIRLSKYQGGKQVFKNLRRFCADKTPGEDVFHLLTTNSLNQKLTSYMEGLTAKVFRTFNASITLQRQLQPTYPEGTSVEEMVVQYNAANREVAILCNHQRSLPKNWDENLGKKKKQLEVLQNQVEELKKMLKQVQDGKEIELMPEKYQTPLPKLEIPEGTSPEEVEKMKQKYREERAERSQYSHMYKSQPSEDSVAKRLQTFENRLSSMTIKLKDLDDNKLVALGTSKINYMDPRITVAWCKRVEGGYWKLCVESSTN